MPASRRLLVLVVLSLASIPSLAGSATRVRTSSHPRLRDSRIGWKPKPKSEPGREAPQERGKDSSYNAAALSWGFRASATAGSINGRPRPSGAPGLSVKAGTDVKARLQGRNSQRRLGKGFQPSAQESQQSILEEVQKVLAKLPEAKDSSLSPQLLTSYLSTSAMAEMMTRTPTAVSGELGGLLVRRSKAAARAGAQVGQTTLQQAAHGGRRLVEASVNTMSACAAHWDLAGDKLKEVLRVPKFQSPQPCIRTLSVVILVESHPHQQTEGPRSHRSSDWWRNPELLKADVLREEMARQGHHVAVIRRSSSRPEESTAELTNIHRQKSLDACLCAGAACRGSMSRLVRTCRLLGITVIEDSADVAPLEFRDSGTQPLIMTDGLVTTSRFMSLVAGRLGGLQPLLHPGHHINYANVGQTPLQAMQRRLSRVLVQVVDGPARTSSRPRQQLPLLEAVKTIAADQNWQVVEGLQQLASVGAYQTSSRAVNATRSPKGIAAAALGLARIQAAVLFPSDPTSAFYRCEQSNRLFLHFLSAGIPTVVFPSLAVLDSATGGGYPLVASTVDQAILLLKQLAVSDELRALSSRRGLEIAARHDPAAAAGDYVRRICKLKDLSRTVSEEKRALDSGECWLCQEQAV